MRSQMSEPQYNGGCFCQNIRYQVKGNPVWVGHCHCHICRRTSGAAFGSWVHFEISNFSLNQEATTFKSSEHGERSFCPICGTQLFYKDSRAPQYIGVTLGSLDQPNNCLPQDHIWTSTQLEWLHLSDDLPRYPQQHPAEAEFLNQ
ncbi:GFA family protein [Capilliphycus salinus ALCB114379]|uniref:GFA family protein n=1 Tax=Capilliphycus salinus TaxID=2768948 RepID=UPI0039A62757